MTRVTDHRTVSDVSAVTSGVKQSCALAPALFSLMSTSMQMDAYRYERPGVRIAYRIYGDLHISRGMRASVCISTTTIHDLLFADDRAFNAVTDVDMRSNLWLHGHHEEFLESATNQRNELGRPRARPIGLEESSEGWSRNLLSQSDRGCQSQKALLLNSTSSTPTVPITKSAIITAAQHPGALSPLAAAISRRHLPHPCHKICGGDDDDVDDD
ncbi:hypothetical protein SprV_0301190800 [Sparganum proliferum]